MLSEDGLQAEERMRDSISSAGSQQEEDADRRQPESDQADAGRWQPAKTYGR